MLTGDTRYVVGNEITPVSNFQQQPGNTGDTSRNESRNPGTWLLLTYVSLQPSS